MTRSPPRSSYDEDFFAWTQEQASALRLVPREAIGELVDVEHVAGEIEDLGKRDLREVRTFLGRLIEHLMKIQSAPTSIDVPHWRAESRGFQDAASAALSPSMRPAIDLALVWRRTRTRTGADLGDLGLPLRAPVDCPFTLDELLATDFDIDAALARLAEGPRPDGA